MNSRLRFWLVTAAFLIFGASSAPIAYAAPPTDACKLLTKAQIKSATGAAVSDGSHPMATFKKMCTWSGSGKGAGSITRITLNLESAASYQSAKAMLQAVASSPQAGINMTPAPGIGDDAMFSSMGSYTKLIVKKGDVVLQIVVYSNVPIEKKRDIEKALAARAISNL